MLQPSMKLIHTELHLCAAVVDAARLLDYTRVLEQSIVECRSSVDDCHRRHLSYGAIATTIDFLIDDELPLDFDVH